MLAEHILLGFVGLCAGAAVSAGTFAFLIVIGVIPRMIGKSHQASRIHLFENAVIAGGIWGNFVSVFTEFHIGLGHALLVVYGLSAGIFVGCIAVALAEIMNTFPIVFRRLGLQKGMPAVMSALAAGKLCGSLFYFFYQIYE